MNSVYYPSGKVVARNLKMLEIQQGSADNIIQAILHYISVSQLDLQKMAGGASDGASVTMSCINGVMMQLKGVVPLFIATHCAAHSLSLPVSQVCEVVPCAKRFERLINQMYTFFSHSTARSQKLMEIQKVLNEPKLKLKRAIDTRWLSHESAINAIRRSYVAVKQTFEQEAVEGDATANGLAIEMSEPSFLYSLIFPLMSLPL